MSLPIATTATATAAGGTGVGAGAIGASLLALMAVIALILAMAWLLRRLPGGALGSFGSMKVVASLAVGVKERVMVVQVGETQLVLGVTMQQITLLKELDSPLPPDPRKGADFAGVLARLRPGGRQ